MTEFSPHEHTDQDLRERVDRLFHGTDYVSATVGEWLGDDDAERDADGKKPLLVWERELLGRDIIQGWEVTASDRLALLEQIGGELIMERYVCLETEDDDGEIEDSFSMNMYTGDVYYEDQACHQTAAAEFMKRFKIVEDI